MRINSIGSSAMGVQEARGAQQPAEAVKVDNGATVNNEKRTDVDADDIINDAMLENSIKQANKSLAQFNRAIERTVHETTHTIMYVLKDTQTNEVIREFPPKKIQDMIAKMWEMAGILVDERR